MVPGPKTPTLPPPRVTLRFGKTVKQIDEDFAKIAPSLRSACEKALTLERLLAEKRHTDGYNGVDPKVTAAAKALDKPLLKLHKVLTEMNPPTPMGPRPIGGGTGKTYSGC
jgi:hypothetical protein